MDPTTLRTLLEAALATADPAKGRALVTAALALLETPAVPPSSHPAVQTAEAPAPPITRACPHPSAQRQAMGGFGASSTQFFCRACGATAGS